MPHHPPHAAALAALALVAAAFVVPDAAAQDRRPPAADSTKRPADEDPPLDADAQKKHDAAVAALVKTLKNEGNREMVRQLIDTFAAGGRAERDALIAFSRGNSNQEYVDHAFSALGKIGGKTVLDHLLGKDALRSRDFLVAVAAARTLGGMKDARAVPGLVEILDAKSTKIEVQGACLLALGQCGKGNLPASEALHRYAEHKHDTVRANALEGIGWLATDEAVAVLVKHLTDDRNTRCRGAAALGLGHTRRKDVVDTLRAAAADESLTVRQCVTDALKELGAIAR